MNKNKTKIAIIGSGISGLGAAYFLTFNRSLNPQESPFEVHLFEKGSHFGGHTNTIDVELNNQKFPVDTGFLVHNDKTYPNLIQFLKLLEVEIVPTDMTLSIQNLNEKIEWGGKDLSTVFGQKRNLLRPQFIRMLIDILDLNKNAASLVDYYEKNPQLTLNDLFLKQNYSKALKDLYVVPMAAAIWSTPAEKILNFPAGTFLRFCLNHHLLQVNGRPQWKTIKGGGRTYVKKIIDQIEKKYLNTPVKKIERKNNKVLIYLQDEVLIFDKVILATHADQTLNLLSDASAEEKEILSQFKYQDNLAIVHTDESFLPERKSLWSAWNYVADSNQNAVSVSYLINKLQPLPTSTPVIVTLNPHKAVAKDRVIKEIKYEHPLFDPAAINAQKKLDSIQGIQNTFYAGAWAGYGFHEDGLKAALKVAKKMNLKIPWEPTYE